MRLRDLAAVTGGRLRGEDVDFSGVGIDSRASLAGRLFVALRGTRCNGHDFLAQARAAGAVAALVEEPRREKLPQWVVQDTRKALGELARHWRRKSFAGTLVGVTGSNGKTTVKEMIAAVLGGGVEVLKSRGNWNNHIGVPLTLLELTPQHRFAVVEMGASGAGEIAYSATLACPHIGVITNAAPAHLQGFGSLAGVAQAKGELITALPAEGTAVLNRDDPHFAAWRRLAGNRRVLSFGFGEAEVRAGAIEPLAFSGGCFHNRFEVQVEGESFAVELALAGRHNVGNALAAVACGLALGRGMAEICAALAALEPVCGRLRPVPAKGGAWILDDCYNANPASFSAGVEALLALGGEPWVILGSFAELGPASRKWHALAGSLARRKGVERLFAVGEECRAAVESFGKGGDWFPSRKALIGALEELLHGDARILVKGSRGQHLETVVEALGAR